jgi:hypothetical protein
MRTIEILLTLLAPIIYIWYKNSFLFTVWTLDIIHNEILPL